MRPVCACAGAVAFGATAHGSSRPSGRLRLSAGLPPLPRLPRNRSAAVLRLMTHDMLRSARSGHWHFTGRLMEERGWDFDADLVDREIASPFLIFGQCQRTSVNVHHQSALCLVAIVA